MKMNIDKTILVNLDQTEQLDALKLDSTDDRNARRRYLRALDKITSEPGKFGRHLTCDGNGDTRQIQLEHRQ